MTLRPATPSLVVLDRAGTSVQVLSGATSWRSRPNADDWTFEVADTTGDGYDDLVAIQRAGGSGRTEMHVLDRSLNRWLSHTSTPLGPSTGKESWSLDLA